MEKGFREMTEKEAWLEIAEMFDSQEPTWCPGVMGICWATVTLQHRGMIGYATKHEMINRLGEYFNPNGKDPTRDFFWPQDTRGVNRTLRATACCFLAAMCDTVTPKRRVKGS